jgi:hypothetical protein
VAAATKALTQLNLIAGTYGLTGNLISFRDDLAKQIEACNAKTSVIVPNTPAITPTQPVYPINQSTIIPHTLPASEAEICKFRSGVTANGISGQVAGNTSQGSLSVGFTTSSTQYTEGTNNVLDATGRGFQAAAKLTEKAMALYEQGKTEEGDAMLARAGTVRGTWLKCPEQELETKTIPKIPAKEGEGKGGAGTIAEPTKPSNKIPPESPVPALGENFDNNALAAVKANMRGSR